MKMKKLLALLLSCVLLLGSVPAFAASTELSLSIETTSATANVGDVVSFTVYLNGANTLDGGVWGGTFWLDLPEGMTLVAGSFSGSNDSGLMVMTNESSLGVAMANASGCKKERAAVAYFSCKIVSEGTLTVGLSDDDYTCINGETEDYYLADGAFTVVPATVKVGGGSNGNAGTGEKVWKYDEKTHWHESAGAKSDEAAHSYDITKSEPTCVNNGSERGTCTVCDYTYNKDIDATGHTDANKDYKCDICGEKLCTQHDPVVVLGIEPTETEDGLTDGQKCSKCGEILVKQEVIKATGKSEDNKTEDNKTEDKETGDDTTGEVETDGNPFNDVKKGEYYYDAVLWAVDNGITNGMTPTTFVPFGTCTRAQVVTFLWRAMGCPKPTSDVNPFTDVDATEYFWCYDAILWAVEKGITNGMSETTFGPEVTCSSAHVVTFLWRANGKPEVSGVASEPYYAQAVAWADGKGLLGVSDIKFHPDNNSPRADIVTYLYLNSKN